MTEPDWTQNDPTGDQVRAWMRKRVADFDQETLAWAAHEHFHRPFHIDVLHKMAADVAQETTEASTKAFPKPGEGTFTALLEGTIPALRIAVCIASTRATRESPANGVWLLDSQRFLKIAHSIIERNIPPGGLPDGTRPTPINAAEVAECCDDIGIDSRFFRLNPEVAAWLDEEEPEVIVDFTLA